MKNLKFRRQYLLTSINIIRPEHWRHIEIPHSKHNLILNYHPDLEITHVESQDSSLVLIGYIIDPFHPNQSNREILERLIRGNGIQQIIKNTESLSGRYVILLCNGIETCMFHDATGFREIYYSFLEDEIYCGSTPNIINKYANLEDDNSTSLKEFLNSTEFRSTGFWVGINTPIQHIDHLMPNFYLDLNQKKYHRYWPDERRKEITLEEGADLMAKILKGTLSATANRYKLHQALTSGWDSRVLLAASRAVKDRIKYCVNKVNNLTDRSADITISKKLAREYDLDFEVIDMGSVSVDDSFKNVFYKNNILARDTHIKVFYNVIEKRLDDTYWVTGTFGNEILRLAFPLAKKKISSYNIAKHFKYDNYEYAIDSIENWLKEAREVYNQYDYNLINMFYWEQFTGNLENLSSSEQDIAREEIRPFNCRKLITTYVSLNNRYRYKDFPKGHEMIIKLLWRDLLNTPVAAYTDRLSFKFKRAFRLLGIELLVDRIYNYMKNQLFYK